VTGLLRVKLRRDLRASWSRFALMVIAFAISLSVVGALLYAWSAVGRETSRAYMSTEPASATLLLDRPIGAGQMAQIAAAALTWPGVIEATGRTQFTTKVAVNGRRLENPLQVFVAAPDDPMRMAKFDIEQGSWPPAPGEVFIGRDTLDLMDIAVGDTLTIGRPGPGQPLRLRVASGVYDPSLPPADEEQTGRAYLSVAALAAPGQQASLDQLKIQVADAEQTTPSRDRDVVLAVAKDVGNWLKQDYGLTVREIQVPPPYEHPHQWQVDTFLVALLAGGAAALLLSTVLLVNMLNTLFTQQIPQIGVMKAIGARSSTIGRFYLLMTLVVAAAATLLALPLTILFGRVALDAFVDLAGVDAVSLSARWWVYVAIPAIGLGLPPLMALIPLVRASRTTVRAAIDYHSLGARTSAATVVVGWLNRLRRLDRGLLMALRNTVRRPVRFLLSVGLLASAGAVFVAGTSMSSGTDAISQERSEQRAWDVDVQLAVPVPADQVTPLLEGLPNVTRVEAWSRVQVGLAEPGGISTTKTYPDQGHGGAVVTGVPDDSTMFRPPKLLEGRWLKPRKKGAVVLNQITRRDTLPGVEVGDNVQLIFGGRPTTWRVVGLVEERQGGVSGIYTTATGFAEAMQLPPPQGEPSQGQPQQGGPTQGQPGGVNMLRVATDSHDEGTRKAVASAAEKTLTDAGVPVAVAASVGREDAINDGHMDPVIRILLAIASAMALVGGVGLASIMGVNILDRTREFAVMHAIGARPKVVRRIVIAEGVFVALASCLVAAIPALVLTNVLGDGLGTLFMDAPLPYRVSVPGVAIWLAVVILGAALASYAAALRASRLTVREALAYL
jgi:putative ABC transport system permease protein